MASQPASKKAKIAEATEENDAAAIIDVDAMDEIGDADDDAVPDADEDWYGPRTPDVQLRVSERKYASGVVVLDAADEAWFNGRAPALIADLEDALAALPILQKPPKDGDKGQTLRVEGALVAATVKLSPAPAPSSSTPPAAAASDVPVPPPTILTRSTLPSLLENSIRKTGS